MDNGQSPLAPRLSLLNLGRAWTRVGYGVLAIATLAVILLFVVRPFLPYEAGKPVPAGYKFVAGKDGGFHLKASVDGAISVFLLVFSSLAAFVWTFVDIIDRRKRFVWLMPMFVCPFIMGLHAIPFAVYLFVGRETANPDESVK